MQGACEDRPTLVWLQPSGVWQQRGVVVASACGKADDCTRLFNATSKMMKDMPMPKGKTIDDFKDKFISECKANPDKYMKDPAAKCILEAKSDEA